MVCPWCRLSVRRAHCKRRTIAITPTKSRLHGFDYVKKVCQEYTELGLKTMYESGPAKPFRFLYMSGLAAERSRDKTPQWLPEYCWMRVSCFIRPPCYIHLP